MNIRETLRYVDSYWSGRWILERYWTRIVNKVGISDTTGTKWSILLFSLVTFASLQFLSPLMKTTIFTTLTCPYGSSIYSHTHHFYIISFSKQRIYLSLDTKGLLIITADYHHFKHHNFHINVQRLALLRETTFVSVLPRMYYFVYLLKELKTSDSHTHTHTHTHAGCSI